jgi:hypothetical protein
MKDHKHAGVLPLLASILCIGLSGGIVIPTAEHGLIEGRGEITKSDIDFLTVGKTVREDVLLRFGEPDLVLNDQRILIYHWSVSHGYWFIGGYYSAGGGPIPKEYLFMLEFDGTGILNRFDVSGSIWTPVNNRIDKWAPQESKKIRKSIFIDPMPVTTTSSVTLDPSSRLLRYWIGEFSDSRTPPHEATLVGYKKAALGAVIAEVRTNRPVADIVRAAVNQHLQIRAHTLASRDADITVIGKVTDFSVTTSLNPLTWDALGQLDVTIEVQRRAQTDTKFIRRYLSQNVSKTLSGPTENTFEQVMRGCLEEMQRQMAADEDLARWLDSSAP